MEDNNLVAISIGEELQRRKAQLTAKTSFLSFARAAWPIVEPHETFSEGMHVRAICEHLQAVKEGQIRNLIINVPPRHGKSTFVCVLFPAWVWQNTPGKRWLFASHSSSLSVRDSVKCRRLIESEWYRTTFDIQWNLASDQNAKNRFDNTETGCRISTSVGGSLVGEGADFLAVDDAMQAMDAYSEAARLRVINWWEQEMSTRANDPRTVSKIVVGQRLHEKDLPGHLLTTGEWEHLCLPARYESAAKKTTFIGWTDPRTEEGQLLWPERFGEKEVCQLEKDLGESGTAGQLQQRPSPAKGMIVHDEWWRYWKELPKFDFLAQSWDLSFDATDHSSFVVGEVWGRRGADKYLIHQVRERAKFTRQLTMFKELCANHPTNVKWVEKKANGAALIDTLKKDIPGIVAVEPHGSKMARAESIAPQIQAGNIYLPHPDLFPWVKGFLHEWRVFPNGTNDDQVDATSQAISQLTQTIFTKFTPVSITGTSKWLR